MALRHRKAGAPLALRPPITARRRPSPPITAPRRPSPPTLPRRVQVGHLWDCIAGLYTSAALRTAPVNSSAHGVGGGVSMRGVSGGASITPRPLASTAGRELGRLSRRMAHFAISTCGDAGLSVTANENCFFGEPTVLDRVLGQFDHHYPQVFRGMRRHGIPHNRPELQMTVAAGMAGVPMGHPCREEIVAREVARHNARHAGERRPAWSRP